MRRALLLGCALSLFASAALSQTKISQLPAASALGGSEPIPTVQAGSTVATTPSAIKTYLGSTFAPLALNTPPSGQWLLPYQGATLTTGTAVVANRINCAAFYLAFPMTLGSISARITTASSGGNIQLGIYANSGGQPSGAVIASTNSISTTSTGLPTTPTLQQGTSVAIPAGTYWGCVNADSTAGGTATTTTLNPTSVIAGAIVGAQSISDLSDGSTTSRPALYASETFGTWPSAGTLTWTEGITSLSNPVLMLMEH